MPRPVARLRPKGDRRKRRLVRLDLKRGACRWVLRSGRLQALKPHVRHGAAPNCPAVAQGGPERHEIPERQPWRAGWRREEPDCGQLRHFQARPEIIEHVGPGFQSAVRQAPSLRGERDIIQDGEGERGFPASPLFESRREGRYQRTQPCRYGGGVCQKKIVQRRTLGRRRRFRGSSIGTHALAIHRFHKRGCFQHGHAGKGARQHWKHISAAAHHQMQRPADTLRQCAQPCGVNVPDVRPTPVPVVNS